MIEEKLSTLIAVIQENTQAVTALTAMQIPSTLESKTVALGNRSITETTIQTSAGNIPAAPNTTTGVELDKKGYPWDARIHAKDHSKLAAGTWKLLRQLTSVYPNKEDWHRYVESVKAEILASVQTNQIATEQPGTILHTEANQAAEAAATQAQTATNQQQTQTNVDPRLIGRVSLSGIAIPEGVALGMEESWAAFNGQHSAQGQQPGMQPAMTPEAAAAQLQNQAIANAAAQVQVPINPVTGLAYTIDDVRAAMMMYQATKGATAIVETLASFAPTLEQVMPEQYGNLIGAMMLRPDLIAAV